MMWNNNSNNVAATRNAGTANAAFNGEYVTTFTVPTKGAASTDGDGTPKAKRVIDTTNLSEEDLQALKKQDPFLYYSIPKIRNTVLRSSAANADVTTQTQRNQNQKSADSRRASRPSQVESSSSAMVERKSCISFECHTDLLLEDLMDDTELFENGDGFDLDTESLFVRLFLHRKRQKLCHKSV